MCQIDIKSRIRQKRPKKAKFDLAFFRKSKKATGVEKGPKITNLASKNPNWQPCLLRPFCMLCSLSNSYGIKQHIREGQNIPQVAIQVYLILKIISCSFAMLTVRLHFT